MRGFGDARLGEAASLVALGRGMIELEQAQALDRRQSIGKGVQAGPEHEDLPHAPIDRLQRRVFGKPAAHRDEQAKGAALRLFLGERDGRVGVRTQDRERERVGKDNSPLDDLMRGPMARRAKGGAARLSVLHGPKVTGAGSLSSVAKLDARKSLPL